MSISEALDNYDLQTFRPSIGDNINRVVWQIYSSLDSKYIRILQAINVRYDWDFIKPGVEIKYLSKDVCDMIEL